MTKKKSLKPFKILQSSITYTVDTTNPKDLIGATKEPISLVPAEGIRQIALAMQNGASKYGAYNWRSKKIRLSVYIDAILRHALLLADGEDIAEDSKVRHTAHIGANIAIIEDARKHGCLIDDRPTIKQEETK